MSSTTFTDPEWEKVFQEANYKSFDDWWNAAQNLVEVGNFRGSDEQTSWSHVSRIKMPDGRTVYLKRQQDHFPNNLILKARKIPTFQIEWLNYQKLKNAGVPTLNIIHFANRKIKGHTQCILISEELEGMTPIDELVKYFTKNGWPNRNQRLAILDVIVKAVKSMHHAGLIHNALYGRHIYINIPIIDGSAQFPKNYQARLIDLERTKAVGKKSSKLIRNDIEKMFRRIPKWPTRDCLWFFKQYLGIRKLTPDAKSIVRKIAITRQ